MNNYTKIFIVVDRQDKTRILAIFDTNDTATKYAEEENGHVFNRMLRTKLPDKNSRYRGYIT